MEIIGKGTGKTKHRYPGFRGLPFPIFCTLCVLGLVLAGCASESGQTVYPPSPGAVPETGMASLMAASPSGKFPGMSAGTVSIPAVQSGFNTEEYQRITDNPFLKALDNPVSTFSIDVDTASYANLRRFLLESRELPPEDAVRIEEMVNYFGYSYLAATGEHPVSPTFAMAQAPWQPGHWLLRVALKARDIDTASLPASNLVFLLDTSGSMHDDNKLPLLKESLKIMVERLRPQDRVSIVAYAGTTGLILDAAPGYRKETIIAAFERLQAEGSTAGGAGIMLAYEVAKRNFMVGGNNRVILCTDGDFNVGVSSTGELERMIEEKRGENVYLTVLGFGMGNYKDSRMETLADKGNGNYAYIDNLLEAKKVLGKEIWGNLFAVAKDVKIQIEFNPAAVSEYRLIGYENRLLSREDFNDDSKDAGEMGAGQTVTAFYELIPRPASASAAGPKAASGYLPPPPSEPLEFQRPVLVPSGDLLAFRLRYKLPGDGREESRLISTRLDKESIYGNLDAADDDFRFACAVIEFGMLLRGSPYRGSASWTTAMERARAAKGQDREGYRAEFIRLVEMAELLGNK